MVALRAKLEVLFPAADPLGDWGIASKDGVEFICRWNNALGAQPTQEQLDAITDTDIINARQQKLYVAAKALLTADDSVSKKEKAVLLVILDTFNRQSKQFRDLMAAIANATSLADLKTRAAAITTEPARTISDMKTAIGNKIDAGNADG